MKTLTSFTQILAYKHTTNIITLSEFAQHSIRMTTFLNYTD